MRSTVPRPPDPVISVELTEVRQGEWELHIAAEPDTLLDVRRGPVTVEMTVTPNLVPGVPFTAHIVWADPAPFLTGTRRRYGLTTTPALRQSTS